MERFAVKKPPQGLTCLIVEDSLFDQKMMTRVIGKAYARMQVQTVSTLAEARAALAAESFSLVLLDNNLPDGTGINYAVDLSRDPKLNHIPIIMVSDWPTPFMWDKAAQAGVLSVIKKSDFTVPFFRSALLNSMRKLRRAG